MKYAWIVNNVVKDVCQHIDPSEAYAPEFAILYDTLIPDNIENGAILENDIWVNPTSIPTNNIPVPIDIIVSPVEFKLLLTPQERVSIKAIKSTDPVVEDFYSILDDPRLTFVNLSLQSTKDAIDYLISLNIIDSTRRPEILSGKIK